ncbi:MAG: deoxyguanosinetriphosphate triphosphohydrolase [Oscillospiraceae bacterium]|nr:deoxyguanosinetriphosphate triphosphohydrolase [Oscillospiraceae bacterium]
MTVREQSEQRERETLAPGAVCAADSRGRSRREEPCPIRTCFQRDRDRILHCKSFRRLMHKTQVFLSPEGDHYRTRLTHTLEVSQIARTVGRALRLNEDLIEAMALGHDLGHTPFGHAGERALDEVCPKGYRHYLQSVRVAQCLENGGQGLNLTWEVKNGIACHTSGREAATLEGQVLRYADKIAYINHDIDDAVRAGVLSEGDLPWDVSYVLGRGKSERIATLTTSLIENSSETVAMSAECLRAFHRLRDFMFEAVYTNPVAKGEEGKAEDVVKALYAYFVKYPEKLPTEYKAVGEREGAHRAACDYISGMSDRYAIGVYSDLFIPKSWNVMNG